MINQELLDFIKKQKTLGQTDSQIMSALTQNGWTSSDVEEAFRSFSSPPDSSSVSPETDTPPISSPISLRTNTPQNTTLNPLPTINSVQHKNSNKLPWFVIIVLVLVIFGLLFYIYQDDKASLSVMENSLLQNQVTATSPTENNNVAPAVDETKFNTDIAVNKVGIFNTGDLIPDIDSMTKEGYSIREELGIGPRTEEGGPKGSAFVVSANNEDLLILYPILYPDESNRISEIRVTSSVFKNTEGVGVGFSLADFTKTYPDFKLWYTYIGDMFVLETSQYAKMQFLLNKTDFTNSEKTLGRSESDTLIPSDFSLDTKIETIRVY